MYIRYVVTGNVLTHILLYYVGADAKISYILYILGVAYTIITTT